VHGGLVLLQLGEAEPLIERDRPGERPRDDRGLLAVGRVVDDQLEHEPVDLGLGQRVRALGLDRVLRGEHEERRRDAVGLVADRDLALLHHLEQRGLHLGRRAVDLVGEQEVREHRAELGVEPVGVRPEHPRADEVDGHEVGRELDAVERAAEDVGDGLDRQRLGQAGDALEQHVAAGEQRDEHALEHRLLADDDALDLEQRVLEVAADLIGAAYGVQACGRHRVLASSGRVPSLTRSVLSSPLRVMVIWTVAPGRRPSIAPATSLASPIAVSPTG
jgi:hypothetical protein